MFNGDIFPFSGEPHCMEYLGGKWLHDIHKTMTQ
jgi:hypothetical protein